MMDVMEGLYQVALERKRKNRKVPIPAICLNRGWTRFWKNAGEECSEVIIAAKNGIPEDTANEVCDLLYHLIVMLVESGISLKEIEEILAAETGKNRGI